MALPLTRPPRRWALATRSLPPARSAALALACALLALACGSSDDAPAAGGADAERAAAPIGVRTVVARSGDLDKTLLLTGELVARQRVDLAPEQAGRLVSLTVDEGDRVAAGDVLGRVDDELLRRDRAEASARLDSARARLAEAVAQMERDQNEVARREPMVAREAFPASELALLRDAANVSAQSVDVARAGVDEAEAALATVRAQVTRSALVAPFDALVVQRHVVEGAMVTAQSPVLSLVDEATIRFVARVPETALGSVGVGTLARVRLDVSPNVELNGRVDYVGGVVDRTNRTVEVRMALDAGDVVLRDGMFGRAEIVTERAAQAVIVPPEVLQDTVEGGTRVWVVEGEAAQPRAVEVTLRSEREVAIDGVSGGARVIVSPPMTLTEGARVHVVGAEGGQ